MLHFGQDDATETAAPETCRHANTLLSPDRSSSSDDAETARMTKSPMSSAQEFCTSYDTPRMTHHHQVCLRSNQTRGHDPTQVLGVDVFLKIQEYHRHAKLHSLVSDVSTLMVVIPEVEANFLIAIIDLA